MPVKCESVIEPMVVDLRETGAIDKTKLFVIVSRKDGLGGFFDRFGDVDNSNAAVVKSVHELNRDSMTDSETSDREGFREDKIGCEESGLRKDQIGVRGFGAWMAIVIFIRQCQERPGV